MLRVDSSKPCRLVYALCKHDYLGFLIEPHIVQLNASENFTLTHQRIFSITAPEFEAYLEKVDYEIIALLDECEQEFIIRKHWGKPIRPSAFFSSHYNDVFHQVIRSILDEKTDLALKKIKESKLFETGKDGNPAWKPIAIGQTPVSVLFHFRRNHEGTRYYPTLKEGEQKIEFMFQGAEIICTRPAWMLLSGTLYHFKDNIDGKKLIPFLNKRFIEIPTASEETYFERFVQPLIEKYAVYAQGFEIKKEHLIPLPLLKINTSAYGKTHLALLFRYGNYPLDADPQAVVAVKLEKTDSNYVFHRIRRDKTWENDKITFLKSKGLQVTAFPFFKVLENFEGNTHYSVLDWAGKHYDQIVANEFIIEQSGSEMPYFLGRCQINIDVDEGLDWFDVHATVLFGEYEIPFLSLRDYILNRIKEFVLPSGQIAIIPDEWFSAYSSLFQFNENRDKIRLKKVHVGLISEYYQPAHLQGSGKRSLREILSTDSIQEEDGPEGFNGTLRAYQKAGYDWFLFLKKYNFGGCLADDMGLGKTVQALALLQKLKESETIPGCSLVIMPTSLVHNWMNEAARFTPQLNVFIYTGPSRPKKIDFFSSYDVVLTTYGVVRLDAELLKKYSFRYIILDESQHIKNAQSKIAKAVKSLRSTWKLILSGTPVENSINDLWSQMSFINPDLLGNYSFFFNEFFIPIEKKGDKERLNRLQALIKPFVLRRTKQQVASELPPKTEQILISAMTEEQEKIYEEIKAYYRNELLGLLSGGGTIKSKLSILQGLTKLRQVANHPRMIDPLYEGDSGKFNDIIALLENTLAEGHKVLVFSSFTKHLAIVRKYLDAKKILYCYLDGATRDRSGVVGEFQTNEEIKLFLISIKAGGVGLNLIEADYVFIIDPWWNPSVEKQAIDRSHRIGQTKNVFIYKFITKNSVEEKILALQTKKLTISDSLITTEPSFVKTLTLQDIQSVFE